MAQSSIQPVNLKKVAYLGPRGTFSEEIALGFYRGMDGQFKPYNSIDAVIRAVADGDADEGIVPVENSLEGSVNITLDTLAHEVELVIVKEMVRPVCQHLLINPGTRHVNVVVSHPQSLAQCRHYLRLNYPGAELVAAESTAAAAYQVASGAKNHAAIGSRRAAEIYGLQVIAADIHDNPNNSTRFIVVSKDGAAERVSQPYKTSLVCRIRGEKPGSLGELLAEFAGRRVNLTKIESRPARTGLGEYIFFFDLDGSGEDQNVREALAAVQLRSLWFKNLGSYPVFAVKAE